MDVISLFFVTVILGGGFVIAILAASGEFTERKDNDEAR